jgi:hypothetical protein
MRTPEDFNQQPQKLRFTGIFVGLIVGETDHQTYHHYLNNTMPGTAGQKGNPKCPISCGDANCVRVLNYV